VDHVTGTARPAYALQLTSKTPETFLDLSDDDETLASLGFANGQWVRR
jgi:hypothetical protein